MKIKILLSSFMLFVFSVLGAQVPQGVNYQAVLRDGSGVIIASEAVTLTLSVVETATPGNVAWKETHAVTTNSFGLVSVVLGSGTKAGGSAAAFASIPWGGNSYSLKTEVMYKGSVVDMGTSPIMSVPYALAAESFSGSKLTIDGGVDGVSESLFEVKNVDGQTIFAVYNEGVQIYVSDGDEKGLKGGFAVKGFGSSKGETDLLLVNADSTRVYVGANADKGLKGGFAVKGFGSTKSEANDLLVVNTDSTRIYIGTNESKGLKGGFAVGSFRNVSKGGSKELFRVTEDSTRIYLTTDEQGNIKGGFSVESTTINTQGEETRNDVFVVAKDTLKTTLLGIGTVATEKYETVLGMYNDTSSYGQKRQQQEDPYFRKLLTIGNGTSEQDRSNAVTIMQNGNVGIGVSGDNIYAMMDSKFTVAGGVNISSTWAYTDSTSTILSPGYLSVEGDIYAQDIVLNPSWVSDGTSIPPTLRVEQGSIYASNIELTNSYDESWNPIPPRINVEGGTISADTVTTTDITLSHSLYGFNDIYQAGDLMEVSEIAVGDSFSGLTTADFSDFFSSFTVGRIGSSSNFGIKIEPVDAQYLGLLLDAGLIKMLDNQGTVEYAVAYDKLIQLMFAYILSQTNPPKI